MRDQDSLALRAAGVDRVRDGTSGLEVWHSVPSVLGTRGKRAQAFAKAWDHWVGRTGVARAAGPYLLVDELVPSAQPLRLDGGVRPE